jgi:hypothetical protein
MNSILNPQFRYTNAASTNLHKTFARIRREQEREKKEQDAAVAEAQRKVANIKGAK